MKAHTECIVDQLPNCDFCGRTAGYDGRTHDGPWANMCSEDFRIHGVGLGLGKGQKFVVIKD